MNGRGFSIVPLLALLTACGGGAGMSPDSSLPSRGANSITAHAAGSTGTIKWTHPTITLQGHRLEHSALMFTAGDTYTEANQCGNAIIYQRVAEDTRGSVTTFKFEFLANVRGPLTCTITDTLQDGSQKEPSATLTVKIK